ncbi:hypothetical protein MKZ20_22040 [Psychrobacillus sp. FSL K6-2684]|uniref:hypothetical protein n=1 Tax=unclassified Psychrobacillus TaxID=2636677 RepID=UPI0030FB651B
MPDSFTKLLSYFIALLLLFCVPTYYIFKNEENLQKLKAEQAVTDFVDNVRTKGYITPKMYEDFQQELELGFILFRTEIKHEKKVYTPIYTDPTNPATFTGEYVVDYDEYYWEQIKDFLFDESNPIPKNERMYKLSKDDFFSVYVENMSKTKATMMFDFFTLGIGGNDVVISIPYGGMVLNEDY